MNRNTNLIGKIISIVIYIFIITNFIYAKDSDSVTTRIYKIIGDTQLKIHIFFPPDFKDTDKRSAFIFFHGGGWVQGFPEWGYDYCKHFSSLGMVAFSVEYRLVSQPNVTPVEIVADVKSAVRWIRTHAKELGIDTKKLAAAGMSAGGHLAACTGIINGYDEKNENLSISSQTNALILLSAPVDPTVDPWFVQILNNHADPKELSPTHHIRSGLPPAILFQGTADQTVPFATAKEFTKKMLDKGNICKLNLFENCDHLLKCVDSAKVTNSIDKFLVENKFLKNLSTVKGKLTQNNK